MERLLLLIAGIGIVSFVNASPLECIQIGAYDLAQKSVVGLDKDDPHGTAAMILGDQNIIDITTADKKQITANLGLLTFGGNTTKIQSKGAMTTFRSYNLEKPIIVRVVDSVIADGKNYTVVDIGKDNFLKKYGEYEYRYACIDHAKDKK